MSSFAACETCSEEAGINENVSSHWQRDQSATEQLSKKAAAIGPEHQCHAHQRASCNQARCDGKGELFGELRFALLDQERNKSAQEEQEPIVPLEHPREAERRGRREIVPVFRQQHWRECEQHTGEAAGKDQP